jgi:polar amino acid transport system permease protein
VLASFDTHLFWEALTSEPYWRGALLAIGLTCASLGAAILIGFPLALGRASRLRAVRFLVFLYSWFFRATPTLLQLLIVWDVFPQLWPVFTHSWYTPFLAAFIALALNEAAYMAEIIRAGLLAVDPGQELAARALGMKRWQTLRRVVVPQAVRIVIPPTGNEFIAPDGVAGAGVREVQVRGGVRRGAGLLPGDRERADVPAEPAGAALHVALSCAAAACGRDPGRCA